MLVFDIHGPVRAESVSTYLAVSGGSCFKVFFDLRALAYDIGTGWLGDAKGVQS